MLSPCIGYCQLDEHGTCIGCGRTQKQIAEWSKKTTGQRRTEMEALPKKCDCEKCECTTTSSK